MDVRILARYPFLDAARDYIRRQGYPTGELATDVAFASVRRRAADRVRASLGRDGIEDVAAAAEADAERELLSYPVARLLAAAVKDPFLHGRFAVAESKLTSRRLEDEQDPDTVTMIVQALGVPLQPAAEGGSFGRLHFLDYLRFAPTRDAAWKLVNQPLRGGYVSLPRDRVIRLAEEALRDRLQEELDAMEPPGRDVMKAFDAEVRSLASLVAAHRARFQQDSVGEVRPEAFPPCMKAIWSGIQGHVNIPHMGRFAIVSFLHKLGMDSEAILKFFSAVPDFDVNKSRYQIEHITGKIGGSTEYTPPNCSTMQTYGVCPLDARDEICLHEIHHPLSYYRKKARRLPPSKPAPKPADAPPAPEAPHAG